MACVHPRDSNRINHAPERCGSSWSVREALAKDGWIITQDPYVISYGERFFFVDLAATEFDDRDAVTGSLLGAEREGQGILVEIKRFRRRSVIADLEQALGQYVLYRLLLGRLAPKREIYLAITDVTFDEIFSEPVGEMVIEDLPLRLLVVNEENAEVRAWIPSRDNERS